MNKLTKVIQKALRSSKAGKLARRIKWRNVAITVGAIAFCVVAAKVVRPISVPVSTSDSSSQNDLDSFYKERDASSVHEEAKKEYESEQAQASKKLREDLSSLDDESRQKELDSFDSTPPVANDSSESDSHVPDSIYTPVEDKTAWTEEDIRTLILAVQHEVGINPDYYPCCQDFDKLQRCMARVIVNRIGQSGFGNTLKEVLNQKNQFTGLLDDIAHYQDLPNSKQFDPEDRRTFNNVMSVINGTDGISHDLVFERCSLSGQSSIYEAWEYAKSKFLADTIYLYYYEETGDGRFIMFIGNPNGAY